MFRNGSSVFGVAAAILLAGLVMFASTWPGHTANEGYPSRPITVIVPFPPGGSADYFARSCLGHLDATLGQPVVFEYKAGAGGIIGTRAVIGAAPDGYTLLVSSVASVLIPPALTNPPAFDPRKDLAPVSGIGNVPAVLVVRASLGIKTFAQLLSYAKAHPGGLNLGTSGAGTVSHLAGELLMRETGIKIVPVHYRGAPPAVTDLLGGHIDVMFSDAPFFLAHIKAAKLIPLAVGTPKRSPALPDVPTTAELGYRRIVASNTYSLFAPAQTPRAIVNRLDELVGKELQSAAVQAVFAKQAASPAGGTPEELAALIDAEAKRWIPLVKALNLKGN